MLLHSRPKRYKNLIPHCFFQRGAGQGHEMYWNNSSWSERKHGSGPVVLES